MRLLQRGCLGKIINETRKEFVENFIELYVLLSCRKSVHFAVKPEVLQAKYV